MNKLEFVVNIERVCFCCNSAVRGYHTYQDILEANYGKFLSFMREMGSVCDPFAVCMQKDRDMANLI